MVFEKRVWAKETGESFPVPNFLDFAVCHSLYIQVIKCRRRMRWVENIESVVGNRSAWGIANRSSEGK